MTEDTANVPVEATRTALRIVEYLHEHGRAGVSEIADAVGSSKSTVHNHLQTLRGRGYVTQEEGEYQLGLIYLDFAGGIQMRNPSFRSIHEKVRDIADQTGEIGAFVIEENGTAVILFIERGATAAETNLRVGRRVPRDDILAGEVIGDAKDSELTGELGEANCRVGDEAFVKGLRSVAAPLSDMDGSLYGALSITGPSHRLRDADYEAELTDHLLDAVNELELDVSYSRY